MPETAKPLLLLRGRPAAPVSNMKKLFIASIILSTCYLSGKIPVFDDIGITRKTQVLAETTMQSYTPKNTPELSNRETRQFQIRQIAIGEKKYVSNNTWGVAKKIDSHTYTMTLQPDNAMGTPGEILNALNTYREKHGKGALAWDDKLAGLANTRAEYFSQKRNLDNHAGFLDYLNNQDGFRKLGFANVGENSSVGFTLEAVHLIEWVYAGDAEHNDNQLNYTWHYVGIGVSSNATDIIFAGEKL